MRARPIVWINALLVLPAMVSLFAGFRNSLSRSQDFQWSGANLTLHHIDPYRQFLNHDPGHLILLSQVPNYLHELYILLLPLGALSFSHAKPIWGLFNCLFAVLSVHFLRRIYDLPRSHGFFILLLLFSSTPFRIVLGNGQQSLLEMLFFCLIFSFNRPTGQGIALGLSYSKYSFSPIAFLYLAFRRRFRVLAISLLPPLLGLLAMRILVGTSVFTLLLEPFAVSSSDSVKGLGDLMTILETAFIGVLQARQLALLLPGIVLLASMICAFVISRSQYPNPRREVAVLAVATLMFLPHRIYDHIFLIIPLAAALATPAVRTKIYLLATIALLWFDTKLVPSSLHPAARLTEQLVVFLILSGMLFLLTQTDFTSPSQSQNRIGTQEQTSTRSMAHS